MTHTKESISGASQVARIRENLAYIAAHPAALYPAGWVDEVKAEARATGLLAPEKPQVGACCRPGIDRGIIYGADYLEAL